MSLNYQRKIIGVERKLGFMYVPSHAQHLMPAVNDTVTVWLEGKLSDLTHLQCGIQAHLWIDTMVIKIRAIYTIIFKERMSEKQLLNTNRNELLRKIESLEERFAVGTINEQLFQKFHDKFQKELADIENENASSTTASQVTMKHCIDFADMICQDPWQLWNNGLVGQRSRLQLLLFPNGIRFNKKTDQLEAVKTSVFFQRKISHTAEALPDSMDELKSLPHLTFDQINCSIRDINEKFTFEYIAGKRAFENFSREFHQYLIRFLEDCCLLMVSAYLSDTRKRIDSPIS